MPYTKYDGTLAAETTASTQNFNGTDGLDTLTGGAGADGLSGGQGDLMIGGAGDDTYYVKAKGDRVQENAGGGVDKIVTWSHVSLADFAHVENLEVGGDKVTGAGNNADNIIQGDWRSQQLYGAGGQDVLIGGGGADTFIVYKGEGNDVIQDFNVADDVVRLKAGLTSFNQVQSKLVQVGSDVRLDLGDGHGILFRNVQASQFTAANFQLELDTSKLGALTFKDEFNAPISLWDKESNPTGTWRPDYGWEGTQGLTSYVLPGNGEKQIYTSPYFRDHPGDFSESPFVSNADGTLSIWARPSANSEIWGYGYTSGMITTRESFSQTYGYFEIRAQLPQADGAWPAFWLLPMDWSWPPELDVMEVVGDKRVTFTTAHWKDANQQHQHQGSSALTVDTADGFHTYGALWTGTDITWYIDGAEVARMATPAGMDKPMYLIANLALGGWGGAVNASHFPAEMKIDYIRAYALGDGTTGGSTGGSTGGGSTGGGSTGGGSTGGGSTGGGSTGGGSTGGGGGSTGGGSTAPKNLVASDAGEMLQGGSGDDVLLGGAGKDVLRGAEGADSMSGGDSFDDMHGNQGADTLSGGAGEDWVVGGRDSDRLSGDAGGDLIYGNLGADWLDGGDGADTIRGGQDDDVLVGGAGDDWLSGDRGSDTLTGGAGADIFNSWGEAGLDRVTDFNAAEGDRVRLEAGATYEVTQSGADTVITVTGGAQVVLVGVNHAALSQGWIFVG
jgi:beta-glucanase (GH16 family)